MNSVHFPCAALFLISATRQRRASIRLAASRRPGPVAAGRDTAAKADHRGGTSARAGPVAPAMSALRALHARAGRHAPAPPRCSRCTRTSSRLRRFSVAPSAPRATALPSCRLNVATELHHDAILGDPAGARRCPHPARRCGVPRARG